MKTSAKARSSTYAATFGRCVGRISSPGGSICVRDPHRLLQPYRTNAQRARAVFEALRGIRSTSADATTVIVNLNSNETRAPKRKRWGLPAMAWRTDPLAEQEIRDQKEEIAIVVRRNHLARTAIVESVRRVGVPVESSPAPQPAVQPQRSLGWLANRRLHDPKGRLRRLLGEVPDEFEVAGKYPGELLLIARVGDHRHAFAVALAGRAAVVTTPLCTA